MSTRMVLSSREWHATIRALWLRYSVPFTPQANRKAVARAGTTFVILAPLCWGFLLRDAVHNPLMNAELKALPIVYAFLAAVSAWRGIKDPYKAMLWGVWIGCFITWVALELEGQLRPATGLRVTAQTLFLYFAPFFAFDGGTEGLVASLEPEHAQRNPWRRSAAISCVFVVLLLGRIIFDAARGLEVGQLVFRSLLLIASLFALHRLVYWASSEAFRWVGQTARYLDRGEPINVTKAVTVAYAGTVFLFGLWIFLLSGADPDAFHIGSAATSLRLFDCLYFSAITLTTIGYGDITPVSALAKIIVTIEAYAAFLWAAIFVNKIVTRVATRSGA